MLYSSSSIMVWCLMVSASQSFVAKSIHAVSLDRGWTSRRVATFLKSATLDTNSEATASTSTTSRPTTILADAADFLKPDRDRYEYRAIQLANNLQVLLTSTAASGDEKSAKVEAASIHVQAGHFDDTIPGLAHFHEHMLFLGTEKYPDEDEYEKFLSKYGGFGNAYTDMEDTNYYFSVTTQQATPDQTSEALSGGLDRLAQFFIAPTFDESMVDRECQAIDSEYRNGKTSDSWRNFQFLKAVGNPNHPFSKFGCGNYETLTNEGSPVGELKRFWETYYTTSNMRLAVVGGSSLDALQKTVEETFGLLSHSDAPPRRSKVNPNSPIFPREHAVYDPEQPAFGQEQLGKIREVIPLMESRNIKLMFATPPMEDPILRRTKPYRVISHLLGHESPGSLHALLNEMGVLTGLTSGVAIDVSDFSLFSLTLSLTPKGMKEKDLVLDLIFQWFALVKQTALEQPELLTKYHDELRQMTDNSLQFRENGDPTDFCSSAAEILFDDVTPPAELLVGSSKCEDYDPVVAQAFLERLRPENAMITIVDSGLTQENADEWQVEPRYGATYRQNDMTAEQLERWENPSVIDPQLHVPGLNNYIPTDFSLRCDDSGEILSTEELDEARKEVPTLLEKRENFRLWHKMDKYWRVPKTFIRLSVVSPAAYESPRSMTLSRIYQRVLTDDLNSFVYDASLSGCGYTVICTPTGYKISVKGYSEKLPFLLDTLTTRMLSLIEEMKQGKEAYPALFDKFKKAEENLLRETKNYRLDAPYEVASYNSRLCMENNVWYLENYIDEMEGPNAEKDSLTLEECALVAEKCLTGRIKADALCIGNIDKKETEQVMNVIDRHFLNPSRPLQDSESPKFRSMKLPTRKEAVTIFGPDIVKEAYPVKYQELALSPSEENNAVEVTLQSGSDLTLGYAGIGILDLISHLAYNSAYNQLRTKEQLGYIVSAHTKKTTGGAWALTVVVQSSSAPPEVLEERIESWLNIFRQELEAMTPESLAVEAKAIVAQLTEGDTKLGQEVSNVWGAIMATEINNERITTPAFDRLDKLADELILADGSEDLTEITLAGNPRKTPESLKQLVLDFFDEFYALDAPERRAMSSRVYNQTCKAAYEENLKKPGVLSTFSDMRYLKDFLSSWSVAPYWRVEK